MEAGDISTAALIIKGIEFIVVIGGVLTLFFKIGKTTERFEMVGRQQGIEIGELKRSIDAMRLVVTDVALQKQRLDTNDLQLERMWRTIDELRHGKGLIDIKPG